MPAYNLIPRAVPQVHTDHRRIVTRIPVPESLPILQALDRSEPRSMLGQPPIVWDRAEGIQVYDAWGNMWLDWSSGVLIANVGHGREEIRTALREALDKPLLATYVFPHAQRAELTTMLQQLAPRPPDYRVFLLSTGSEATENAIKLARTYGVSKGGKRKHVIIGFENGFHGRTLGAQLAGGSAAQKAWIVKTDVGFVHVPFPDGYRNPNIDFSAFLEALHSHGLTGDDVAGVIAESYQGGGPYFFPKDYAHQLEAWCKSHDVTLIMDEVQAGFGRTGKMFAYQHYGIAPDLICCGKGISSSLPISAVIGRADIMDLHPAGSMTSTHSGSPLPVAAAIANLKILEREQLVAHAAYLDEPLRDGLLAIRARHGSHIGAVLSRGLVAGLQVVMPDTKTPDGDAALAVCERCFEKGLLMFAPVGLGGGCIKIAPPLITTREALEEGLSVLSAACDEVWR